MVLESNFTPKGGGGAESQLRTLALHLERLGHDVTVMTPLLPSGPQRTAERVQKIPIGRVRYPRRRVVGAAIMNLRFAAFLLQHRKRYDAWHVHIGHNMGAVTCVFGALLGKPVVVKISGWWELEKGLLAPGVGLLKRAGRSCLKRASATQAISSRIAAELERCGFPRERIVLLPNAVDVARFKVCAAPRTPGAPFTAVYVGRLVDEKGLETLLDAWAEAFGSRTDVRLKIVGGGPLEARLRAQTRKLEIDGQVQFLGHLSRVEDALTDAHVGVLPSRIEGLSNVLLEFMACGLPTLASKVSGSEDFVVTGRNGWLFDVSDAPALARHLREAEALPAEALRELGSRARADVEARASVDLVVGQLLALYERKRGP
jgi:glycosyltransferase involved in cell wall biosynthesis